mmetsp:Transcript_1657/g.4143  ORF Transcript_1657/g.4143 Transcript_1657/m.4143 type:complete len:255 (-) Transcript_1657:7-771(-)
MVDVLRFLCLFALRVIRPLDAHLALDDWRRVLRLPRSALLILRLSLLCLLLIQNSQARGHVREAPSKSRDFYLEPRELIPLLHHLVCGRFDARVPLRQRRAHRDGLRLEVHEVARGEGRARVGANCAVQEWVCSRVRSLVAPVAAVADAVADTRGEDGNGKVPLIHTVVPPRRARRGAGLVAPVTAVAVIVVDPRRREDAVAVRATELAVARQVGSARLRQHAAQRIGRRGSEQQARGEQAAAPHLLAVKSECR